MKAEPVKDLLVNMQDYVDVANDNAAFMDDHDWGHQIGFLLSANECQEILTKIQSLTEQLKKANEIIDQLTTQHP